MPSVFITNKHCKVPGKVHLHVMSLVKIIITDCKLPASISCRVAVQKQKSSFRNMPDTGGGLFHTRPGNGIVVRCFNRDSSFQAAHVSSLSHHDCHNLDIFVNNLIPREFSFQFCFWGFLLFSFFCYPQGVHYDQCKKT